MDFKNLKQIFRPLVLFAFGFIDLILIIRILLKFIGASTKSTFVKFWYQLSAPLYNTFSGTVGDFQAEKLVLEIDSVIAVAVYFIFALLLLRFINAAFMDLWRDKIKKMLDSFFKFVEFILIARILFKIIGAGSSNFIKFLYGISYPFYYPFKNILVDFEIGDHVFEISTLIAIVIIIIFDIVSDLILKEVIKGLDSRSLNNQNLNSQTSSNSQDIIQPINQNPQPNNKQINTNHTPINSQPSMQNNQNNTNQSYNPNQRPESVNQNNQDKLNQPNPNYQTSSNNSVPLRPVQES